MKNLKAIRSSFKYRTAEEGKAIQVEIDYSKGGANYFSGGNDPRGIYAFVRPIELRDGFLSFDLMKGNKVFLKKLARKNDRELVAMAERVDFAVPLAAKLAESEGFASACKLILEASLGNVTAPEQTAVA